MTASVLCHSPKKNNNCLVKAKVKRTELLSAELMLHPIYLSIYLSIYLLNLSHPEPAYQSRQQ